MKIICIGRNYAEHVKELHNTAGGPDGLPTEPVFFLKPDTALLRNNDPFYIPSFSQEVHYECELVVRINRVGKCIEERFAHRYYDEVGLGIDRIIHHISQYITLKIGDLIYTGTPAGVGPVHPGDNLKASLEGHMLLDFDIR